MLNLGKTDKICVKPLEKRTEYSTFVLEKRTKCIRLILEKRTKND